MMFCLNWPKSAPRAAQVQEPPRAPLDPTKSYPRLPQQEKKDIRNPLPFPSEVLAAIAAPGGWNTALPIPPSNKIARRADKLGAKPISDKNSPEIRGPAITKTFRPNRSAKYPAIGCIIDDDKEKIIDKAAAKVMDRPNLSMSLGSNGCKKDA